MPAMIDGGLTLVEPNGELEDSYRGMVREFVGAGEDLIPFPLAFPHDDFASFLERLSACSRGEELPPGFVPHSTYWLVKDGTTVVGVSNVRHQLTAALLRDGGSIGYGVRPSARGMGYATELLRQTLIRAGDLGLTSVLLTCNKTNHGSVIVIMKNGGVLDSEEYIPEHGDVVQRFWIGIETGMGARGPAPSEILE